MRQHSIIIKNIWRLSLICIFAFSISSCKTKKLVSEVADNSLNARQIVTQHNMAEPDFTTLASRVQVNYDDGKSTQRVNANIRMKKDEIIWITASVLGITVAKALLTPDSVSVYESISKSYFEGDYALISDWLGVDIDFQQAQALLLGQATVELKPNALNKSISDNKYILEPNNHDISYRQSLAIYPSNFKIANHTIEKFGQKRIFTLDYGGYQKIEESYYPLDINFHNIDNDKIMRLHLQVRKVDVNPNLSFPYRIPSGYKQMQIE